MDYLAGILELFGSYLLGEKNQLGFIFNVICCGIWVYVAIKKKVYGLLIVVVPNLFINIINYVKWSM